MKSTIRFFILFSILNSITWITPQKASAQSPVNFQVFYDNLSPYGSWIDNSDYGYVWMPNQSSGFTPYGTNGYWVFTDAGWTWVSNYSWGWGPFHYGRWFYDRYYGWLWVPDNEWGPGWVSWRRSEGYYGWAPIGPGISMDIAYSNDYRLPFNQWTFVRDRDFGRTNITNYYINSSGNTTIINNSVVINNIYSDHSSNVRYNTGPGRTEVEKQAGRTITPVALRETNKPGQNLSKNELQIYRPRVEKNNNAVRKPAPFKVASVEEVKLAVQRNNENSPKKEQQRNDQPTKLPSQQRNDQPAKLPSQQRNDQPTKQPSQQRNDQPAKLPSQHRYDQPTKQPSQQRNDKPTKQPSQQRNDQPTKQPSQQRNDQPTKQPSQQRNDQPTKLPSQQRNDQPTKLPTRQRSDSAITAATK